MLKFFVFFLPLAAVPVAFFESFTGFTLVPPDPSVASHFIENVIFLNWIHVLITFYLVLFYKPVQQALLVSINGRVRPFILSLLGGSAIILFLYAVEMEHLSVGQSLRRPLHWVYQFMLLFLPFHHGLWQSRGISLFLKKSNSQPFLKIERFWVSTITISAPLAAFLMAANIPLLSLWTFQVLFFVGLISAAVLFIAALISKNSQRMVFDCRYFLFCLAPFSSAAAWAITLFHGPEYLYFILKFRNRPAWTTPLVNYKGLFFVVVVPTLLLMHLYHYGFATFAENPGAPLKAFDFLSLSLSFCFSCIHYYMDRKIFAMGKPEVREKILLGFSN